MHEMSLAGGILQVVEGALQREAHVRLKRLTIEVGALAGVETRALDFALRALAPGTVLQGADIVLDEVPGQAWCLQCSATVPIHHRIDLCPQCGSAQLQPTGGTELKVRDLVVVDAPASQSLSEE